MAMDMQPTIDNFNGETRIDFSKYRYLVATMSKTFQSVVCFCQAVKSEQVFLIVSEDTTEAVDEFYATVNKYCKLGMSGILWKPFKSADPPSIYSEVLGFCKDKNPKEILFDVTAGKKPMSGAAILAAEMLHADVAYCDYGAYNWDKGKPEPGTEFGRLLEMPYTVFGDLEIKKAVYYLQGYHFSGAVAVLEELVQRLDNVGVVKNLLSLSRALLDWDSFHYHTALEELQKVELWSKLTDTALENMRGILAILCDTSHDEHNACELANFYFTGHRYAQNEKYDLGVFMMYRVAERNAQLRLLELGINASDINGKQISDDAFSRYRAYKKDIFGEKTREEVSRPTRVGCLETYILLHVLEHPAFNPDKGLKFCVKLQAMAQLRNKSVYVHGTSPLGKEEFEQFESFSHGQLHRYLTDKSIRSFDDYEKALTYPWLSGDSEN